MRTRFAVLLVAGLMLAAPAAAPAKPKPISTAAAFTLPSPKACVAGHQVTLLLRKVPHVTWTSVTVKINGRTVKSGKASFKPIRLTGLPNGTFTLKITAKARGGRGATATRTYTACATTTQPKPKPKPTPTPTPRPTATPTPAPTATATPTPTPAPTGSQLPGSYTGAGGSYTLTFFVSPDGGHVQDVTVATSLGCTPTHAALGDRFVFSDIAIAADGSFSGTAHQTGQWSNASATFTYVFSGRFTGTTASGTLRETIAFDNGVAYTCTTNDQTWSVHRDVQGVQTADAPPAGSYTGASGSYTLGFYVANDRKSLQDVTVATALGCVPTRAAQGDRFVLGDVPLAADGSFDTTSVRSGAWAGSPATFTYVFRGHVHSVDSSGTERLAGILRETIAFDDGTSFSCTTDDQYWYADRDAQGVQSAAAPPAGSYTGASGSYTLNLYVANDQKSLQDVTVATALGCTPSRAAQGDRFVLSDVPLAADGSFDTTATQTGTWAGASATFTYELKGHVHSVDSAGVERIAGTLRETLAFNDGTAFTCTTNDQYWSVTRDAQGVQSAAAPPAGSYTGASGSYTLSLYVANDQKSLQDVTVAAALGCTPSHAALGDRFVFSQVPLAADGSFDATATQQGVVSGAPATFTYVFKGHVHSVNSAGTERLAGVLRETIAFNDGTSYSCTTDDQYWSVLRDSQGTQTAIPAAGAYTGASGSYTLTFSVSGDAQHVQNVSVPTALACTPAHSALGDHLTIADVPIAADGSFDTTTQASGTISGAPATFTYRFRGHVHGLASNGATRLAGVLREEIAFNNGTAYSCTTNDQYWSATH
jgi:hypothetical protein